MERIKVAVSPFYSGKGWTDEYTNIRFETNPRGLNVYTIPTNLDLTGINKSIRLNSLILVEGDIEDFNEVKEVVIGDEHKEKIEEPVLEAKVSEPVSEDVEEKTPKATAKRTKKTLAKDAK